MQERTKKTPEYKTEETEGGFSCIVRALDREGSGEGASKKAAETEAARALYEQLTEERQ